MNRINGLLVKISVLGWLAIQNIALAGEVQILAAEFRNAGESNWNINVTLKHQDSGWSHYADAWRVIDMQGKVLGNRVLMHPHVNEQPFTRGLSGITIPEGISQVLIKAHDNVHGWSKDVLEIDLLKSNNGYLLIENYHGIN